MSHTRKTLPPASAIVRLGIAPPALLTILAVLGLLTTGCITQHPVVGLKPKSPSIKHEVSDLMLLRLREAKETHVDILRPTFRWEPFPRLRDREEIDTFGERIKTVTYELRLWKVGERFSGAPQRPSIFIGTEHDDYKYSWMHGCRDTDPGELVYSRQGIGQPEHTMETPLQPGSRYFWTVRAHFTLDGRRRATQWSQQLPDNSFVSQFEATCLLPATFHLIHTP